MPINLDQALGAQLDPVEFSWTSSDIQLYHLGLGAGQDPMDNRELRYLVDETPQVLPSFGNVAQSFHMTEPPTVKFPGIDIELSKVLHASEAVSAPAPIPPSGTGRAVTKFTDIWDKGKAAVIWSETTVTTPDGEIELPVELVEHLLCDANWKMVTTNIVGVILNLGYLRRYANRAQRRALTIRDGGCTGEDCDVPASMCHAHHDIPFSEGGATSIANGRLLCGHHHRRIHDPNYAHNKLATGKIRFHRRT